MSEPNQKACGTIYSSDDVIDIVFDGPGDTTVRPLRPELRELSRRYPYPQLPPRQPPFEEPPKSGT
jgi:hypothetical protein